MERSRYCLVLALVVLLSARGICGDEEEDNGVPAVPCRDGDEECFAEVPQGGAPETFARGCCSHCPGSADTSCCEFNRCNSQAVAAPAQRADEDDKYKKKLKEVQDTYRKLEEDRVRRPWNSLAGKTSPPGTFLFVATLLVIRTTVEVLFV